MAEILCTGCRRPFPEQGHPFRCPTCGGVYDFAAPLPFQTDQVDASLPGIWRYRAMFGLPYDAPLVSLGEGLTPLVWEPDLGRRVAFKLEYLNPTGSFKDRGTALLVSTLLAWKVESAVEDSSGNAGASFAAYAARAGIRARVFVPDYASGPKRAQIAAYGAEVVRILGPRSQAAQAVKRAAEQGAVYASHAYQPFGLPGFATMAYELVEQLGEAPGTVITPVGHGSLLLGMGRGFQSLKEAGLISELPALVAVQARACAPIWAVHTAGAAGMAWMTEGETVAEGVRIAHPLRGDAVLAMVEASQGTILAVEEADILAGRDMLAQRGFYVEPTSAIVWSALERLLDQAREPIVVVLTGSGFKYQD